MEITDHLAEVKGGELFVRRWFPGNAVLADPLVLLHDSLGSVEQWREFPQLLALRLRRPVLAYDRLGFGKSSARHELPSVHFVEEEASRHFPAVAGQMGIGEFVLFGHSVGGAMALAIAALHSARCRGVITESAQAFVEQRTLDGIRAAETSFAAPEVFDKLRRWHGDKAQWVFDAWTKVWLSPDFSDWSVDCSLSRVTAPLLAIHGDQDEYGSVAFPERIVRGASGVSRMEILSGCGHVPHRDRRDDVLALVSEFLHEHIAQ